MPELEGLRRENGALQARVTALEAALNAKPLMEREPIVPVLQAMPLQIGIIDGHGTCVFLSANFAPWLRDPSQPSQGRPFAEVVIPALIAAAGDLMVTSACGVRTRDVTIPDREGSVRDLEITVSPRQIGPGQIDGLIWAADDQTHHRLADEALRRSERRLTLATEAAGLGVWDWGLADDSLVYSDQARIIYGFPPDRPVTFQMVRAATHPEDLAHASAMVERATDPMLREHAPWEFRIVRPDGSVRWVLAHGEAVFEETPRGAKALRYVGTIQDITDQARAAERRQLLINELNHRVKNTLATVQSIVRQTLRPHQSSAEARSLLTSRLIALSAAHDILTRENWETASLRDIVATCTRPFETRPGARFDVQGPALRVTPKAAVALAMALHELATNAAKYGSLSAPQGRVSITWSLAGREGEPRLVLDWREQGGPPVSAPERRGFGTRLLVDGLPAELGAAAELTYASDGLRCHIDAPLSASTVFQPG